MKYSRKKLSAEEIFAGLQEEKVTVESVMTELNIILNDCFTGDVSVERRTLKIKFLNGQKFKLTVKELR